MILTFLTGFISGAILTGFLFAYIMKRYMIVAYRVNKSFKETEKRIKNVIPEFKGWGFPIPDWEFYKSQLSKNLKYDNIKNAIVHFVCKPVHANSVVKKDPKMAGIMPCSWSVYETNKGEVYIAKMNIALMSKMYSGLIGEVMKDVASTEKKMLDKIMKG